MGCINFWFNYFVCIGVFLSGGIIIVIVISIVDNGGIIIINIVMSINDNGGIIIIVIVISIVGNGGIIIIFGGFISIFINIFF